METGAGLLIALGLLLSRLWRIVVAGTLTGLLTSAPGWAAGPVETNIFAVQGVDVDVTSTDAAMAKNQALMDVQVKAFFQLVARLGSPELSQELQDKLKPEDIAPYLRSLSIEEESSAPGRYIGKFTVRFLPSKMQKLFSGYGIQIPTTQAEPILVLPVWRGPEANQMWEDNAWRKAWLDLNGEQGLVPIIVPLGDLEDTETLTVEDALHNDPIKLEAIRRRYDAPSVLVAQAEPVEGGIHVYIEGQSRLGKVTFNKIFKSADGQAATAAPAAIEKFQSLLVQAYKKQGAVMAAARSADEATRNGDQPQLLAVSVPFRSPREWNAIRSRILATPNVVRVDLSSLSANGAVIRLSFVNSVVDLQDNMQRAGLNLAQLGASWVIQPM